MLMIRLQRLGKKGQPSYRLVVSEKLQDTQGRSTEIVGHYSPLKTPKVLELNKERILHWIGVGAQLSATVNNLLMNAGVIEGKKKKSVYISRSRKAKLEAKKKKAEAAVAAPQA